MSQTPQYFSGYKNNVCFELTINSEQQFEMKPNRNVSVRTWVKDHLKSHLLPYADYYLVPEISEPRKTEKYNENKFPRIHFHGIVKFHDFISFLMNSHVRFTKGIAYCFSDLRYEYWTSYMLKQEKWWEQAPPYNQIKRIQTKTFQDITRDNTPLIGGVGNEVSGGEENTFVPDDLGSGTIHK